MLWNCFICRVSEVNTDQKLPVRTSDAVDGSSQTGKYYTTSTYMGCVFMCSIEVAEESTVSKEHELYLKICCTVDNCPLERTA